MDTLINPIGDRYQLLFVDRDNGYIAIKFEMMYAHETLNDFVVCMLTPIDLVYGVDYTINLRPMSGYRQITVDFSNKEAFTIAKMNYG